MRLIILLTQASNYLGSCGSESLPLALQLGCGSLISNMMISMMLMTVSRKMTTYSNNIVRIISKRNNTNHNNWNYGGSVMWNLEQRSQVTLWRMSKLFTLPLVWGNEKTLRIGTLLFMGSPDFFFRRQRSAIRLTSRWSEFMQIIPRNFYVWDYYFKILSLVSCVFTITVGLK